MFLLSSVDFFSRLTFSKIFFQEHYQSVSPVGPDLGPNCLQRLSADDKNHCKQGKSSELRITHLLTKFAAAALSSTLKPLRASDERFLFCA